MRGLLSSCVIAFSTYSRIPMPTVDWNEKNMRYTLAFFPMVGAAVGVLYWLTATLCGWLGFGGSLTAALLTALPIAVTGGIHLDGYCDTVDALASHATREKRLQILKDPNAGAFAVLWCGVWLLLTWGLTTEAPDPVTVASCFVLSRVCSAISVDRMPSARDGMGAMLKKGSKFPLWIGLLYLIGAGAVVYFFGEWVPGLVALTGAVAVYFLYRRMAMKAFGGFTGDLAGWFLSVNELVMLALVVLTERVCALWF